MATLKHPLSPDEALAQMERFCAYRERCPQEVRRKLAELGMKGKTVEQIFEVLRQEGYFDEERFAMAFAGGKFRNNHWGRVRIGQALKMRGIAADVIVRALASIDKAEYLALLQKLLDKKKKQYAADKHGREKTVASLIRAGFEMELIWQEI